VGKKSRQKVSNIIVGIYLSVDIGKMYEHYYYGVETIYKVKINEFAISSYKVWSNKESYKFI